MLSYSSDFSPSSAHGCSRSGSAAAWSTVSRPEGRTGTQTGRSRASIYRPRARPPTAPVSRSRAPTPSPSAGARASARPRRWHDGRNRPEEPAVLDRRTLLTTAAGTAAAAAAGTTGALLGAAPPRRRPTGPGARPRLDIPWGLAFLPNGNALVTERETARVHRVNRAGGARAGRPDRGRRPQLLGREGGLLGVAVSPTFAADRRVFFYLTTDDDNRIISMRYVDGGLARPGDAARPASPGRRATTAAGWRSDRAGACSPAPATARTPTRRRTRTRWAARSCGSTPTAPPGRQPLRQLRVVLRAPQRAGAGLGRRRAGMWATEFGADHPDELNRIRPGRNYGWPETEGPDGPGGFTDPFATWSPDEHLLAQRSGHHPRPGLDRRAGRAVALLRRARRPGRGPHPSALPGDFGRIRAVARAPDGSLWITTSNGSNDKVVRLRPDR